GPEWLWISKVVTRPYPPQVDPYAAGIAPTGFGTASATSGAGGHSASGPYQHLGRGRVVTVAGVVQLRAVGDQHDHVHVRGQLDILARRGDAVFEGQAAFRGDRHVHEEVDIGADVALLQTAVVQAGAQEVVAAAVHVALVQGVAHRVAFLGAGAAEGIVAAAGVRGDGQQRVAEVGVEHRAGGQVDAV